MQRTECPWLGIGLVVEANLTPQGGRFVDSGQNFDHIHAMLRQVDGFRPLLQDINEVLEVLTMRGQRLSLECRFQILQLTGGFGENLQLATLQTEARFGTAQLHEVHFLGHIGGPAELDLQCGTIFKAQASAYDLTAVPVSNHPQNKNGYEEKEASAND